MREFGFLNYCTEYSSSGSIKTPLKFYNCFSNVFSKVQDKHSITYNILLNTNLKITSTKHISNYCPFTKQEIRNHLRSLRLLYPISYRVYDYNQDKIMVKITLENVPTLFHKYVLTWIRYTYEYPYNMVLKDTYLLKKDPRFKFESVSNLFNVVLGCLYTFPRTVHQVTSGRYNSFLKVADIKRKLIEHYNLNSIYKEIDIDKPNTLPYYMREKYTQTDVEYWREGFEERKLIYLDVYKSIKQ